MSSVVQSGLDPTLAPSDGPPLFEEYKAEVQIFLMRGYPWDVMQHWPSTRHRGYQQLLVQGKVA